FVYDGNGVLDLMMKLGNYPAGEYELRISMRDDVWGQVPVGTNQVVETNELGVVIGTNDVVEYEYQFIRYDYYISETSEVKVVEQDYADWVKEQWVCPVFSDATATTDDANRDRVNNYDDYLAGIDPLRPVDIHYAYRGTHEPLRGVYLAAFINGNSDTLEEIEEFTEKAGKGVAVYGRFVDLYENCYPAEWMERIHYNYPGAGVHLVLEPWMAFTNFYGANWAPGQPTYEQAKAFVDGCATSGLPVFLRFAHEANGWWYPWCPASRATDVTTEQYIEGWRNFAQMVHERAPNVAMVWAPNQGSCDRDNVDNVNPDALADYAGVYPGDDAVDWVGMSLYNGSWYGNGDEVQDYQFSRAIHSGYSEDTFQDFYWTFSDPDNPDGHKKPMMIAETSFQYVPRYSLSNTVVFTRFESMDGPEILDIENTPYEGMETALTNHWNWGFWDCLEVSTTSDCVEGSAALLLHPTGAKDGGVYVGGFGRNVTTNAPDFRDWTPYNGIRITLRRGAGEQIDPIVRIEMKDICGNLASYQQVVSWTNYQDVQLYLDRFDYPDGFAWDSVIGLSFHIATPESNVAPADVYMDHMRLSVIDMLTDQEWVASWDLTTWEQTDDSVSGQAMRMGGVVTNGGNYVGGCLAIISRPDRTGWDESDALVFYVKRGGYTTNWGVQPDPKLKIVLDSDWDDNNGTEASVEFKVSNAEEYARMVIPFEDFQTGDDFEWDRVNKMIFHMMTSDGPNPFDLYIDEISRTSAIVTNANDDLSIKADWMNQLYGLQENNSVAPYYSDVSRKFRNIHMVNWFHIRKIEDGEMRDFRLPEYEGAVPVYSSYYERVQAPYFLTNVVTDRSGDGIPDEWSQEYFGTVTNDLADLDSDGDGFSNWQEYVAGTRPDNADSFLYSSASVNGSAQSGSEQYRVTWPSEVQRVYSIAYTTNLLTPMTMVATNIPATYPTNTYVGTAEGYYRIMVSP
ncbi:MAG: glycosyl hydrolase, partial [Kiritimatiellae bacterium]|nr:glycosyl hydrolase [Kiritimatiellia bacterium]